MTCPAIGVVNAPTVLEDHIFANAFSYTANGDPSRIENNAIYLSCDDGNSVLDGGAEGNLLTVTVWYFIRTFGSLT